MHAEDMPHPSELGHDEDGFHTGGYSTVQDLKIGDIILATYSSKDQRARMWKFSSFLMCLRYSVQDSLPWMPEG